MAGDWGSKPYFSGSFVPLNQANLNIQTHALQYGTACFGGIRAYFNEENRSFIFSASKTIIIGYAPQQNIANENALGLWAV